MNTIDKIPEQLRDFDEKIKKAIAETPESNWYRGSFSGVSKTTEQMMKEWQSKPWVDYEERQLLPEPDCRQIAATEAGKIPHGSVQEYLTDCDKIYNWLMTNEIKRLKRMYPLRTEDVFETSKWGK